MNRLLIVMAFICEILSAQVSEDRSLSASNLILFVELEEHWQWGNDTSSKRVGN